MYTLLRMLLTVAHIAMSIVFANALVQVAFIETQHEEIQTLCVIFLVVFQIAVPLLLYGVRSKSGTS